MDKIIIEVSKDAVYSRINNHIENIITEAKNRAILGVKKFYYKITVNDREEVEEIISLIEKNTSLTVSTEKHCGASYLGRNSDDLKCWEVAVIL